MMSNQRINSLHIKWVLALGVAALVIILLIFYAVGSSTSTDLEVAATLVPSDTIRVTGVLRPFHEHQVVDRHIVLCQLEGKAQDAYDCRLTSYLATTDKQGQFELTQVKPGDYLIIYDSGLADFDQGVRRWKDTVIHLGDLKWLSSNGFFGGEPDGDFLVCGGGINGWADFYILNVDLTLCGSGSPFVVAHDIEAALEYDAKRDGLTLPPGVFKPVMVKVEQGYASHVEFSALTDKH
jgi:hypothetical protein